MPIVSDRLRYLFGYEKKGYVDVPATASFICVQLVYRDGEVTEARRFEPDK